VQITRYSAEVSAGGLVGYLRSLRNYRFVFSNMYLSRFHKRYQDSTLGILWSAMTPLLMMTAMAIIFPLIMRHQMENYLTYLFSGVLSWSLLSASFMGASEVLLTNKGMMKKVYLPKIIFPAAGIAVDATNFALVALVLHVVLVLFGASIHTDWLYLLCAMLVQSLFCFGVASIICVVATYFRDIKHILGVFMQAFFYLTPIIYPETAIPTRFLWVMELNPFYQFVRLFHQGIYFGESANWSFFIPPLMVALLTAVLGVLVQYKYDRVIVYRL
jgi:ABC-type polysaccharide/polyol phosphate export permease